MDPPPPAASAVQQSGMLIGLPILLAVLAIQPEPAPPTAPAAPASNEPEAIAPVQAVHTATIVKPDPAAVDLLTRLETAGDALRTLESELTHINKKSDLEGNLQTLKRGRLYFRAEPGTESAAAPRKVFQIDFREVEFDNKRLPEDQSFIFDGRWLVEKQSKNKQMFKYEVVPPGQTTDPLAVGEGPFPVPIGQKRDRILERFLATVVPSEEGFPQTLDASGKPFPLPEWVKSSVQLKLVPRTDAREARDFQEVRIWYDKADLLPRMAKTLKIDDSSDEVLLRAIKVNQALPEGVFVTDAPTGWNVQVDRFKDPNADQ